MMTEQAILDALPICTRPLYVKGFKAKLPNDFGMLLKVEDSLGFHITLNKPLNDRVYTGRHWRIHEDHIYFSGDYNKWWIINIFQKLWENLFPKKYFLYYLSVGTMKMAEELINKLN